VGRYTDLVAAPRKPAKVVVRSASPQAIRRSLKITASEWKAVKRVISELRLDDAVKRAMKTLSPARLAAPRGGRPHPASR
jgi:hypothetical protein